MLRSLCFASVLVAVPATHSDSRPPRVIAPLSTVLPTNLRDSAGQALFDSLIASQLVSAGFNVLPTGHTDSIWRQTVQAAGGYFDPQTGEVVQEKLRAVRRETLEQVQRSLGADVLMFPEIKLVRVHYYKSWAQWDGASEKVLWDTGSGDVPALSLQVVVTDAAGRTIYCGRGGIQVLAKGNFVHGVREVNPEKVFRDIERDEGAVRIALQSLIQDSSSCRPP